MRHGNKLVRRENTPPENPSYLCSSKIQQMNTLSFILAVALATVVTLIIIALAAGLIYHRWRTAELMKGISDFISRNWQMEKEIERLQQEIKKQNK